MDAYGPLNENKKCQESGLRLVGFPSPKRQGDYQGYRGGASDRPAGGMPVLLGAGLDTFVQRRPGVAAQIDVFEIDRPGPQACPCFDSRSRACAPQRGRNAD